MVSKRNSIQRLSFKPAWEIKFANLMPKGLPRLANVIQTVLNLLNMCFSYDYLSKGDTLGISTTPVGQTYRKKNVSNKTPKMRSK